MKALSIRQPWAWLICAGYKDVENRTWHIHMPPLLNYPATPRRIYVHTGKVIAKQAFNSDWFKEYQDAWVRYAEFLVPSPLRAIIGEVDIVGCKYRYGEERDELYSKWHEVGMYGLLLANPTLYDKPIPCKGMLGFFEPGIPSKE